MRAALLKGEDVVNVIEYDPKAEYDPAPLVLLELGTEPVGPGWRRRNGQFLPPPVETLAAVDNTATIDATYTNTYDDAPASVTFDVNGATATVALTNGAAELAITPPASGEVVVSVPGRPVEPITLRGA